MPGHSPTRRTVLIAGAANLFVGVIKLLAGVLVGSSAMLAEAAHSAADTLNQAFLLASLRRGERPAHARTSSGVLALRIGSHEISSALCSRSRGTPLPST